MTELKRIVYAFIEFLTGSNEVFNYRLVEAQDFWQACAGFLLYVHECWPSNEAEQMCAPSPATY